ncbi:MAG TPA: PD-(D/E)XK nuclease family protein, partial [Spirochaetota bacterium]|nr:PD-(D/E)XK nuclease family protein [Spirochaetota bacterium]
MNEDQIVTKFLLDTKAIEILESKLKEFNPFSIMKIENYEIRHSNILSWLFNPIENHHLSDKVLKKFLLEVILNNEALKIPFSIRDIYLLSFTDVEVYREYKNIDIFIKSEKNKTIILIENKIKSKESPGQLT